MTTTDAIGETKVGFVPGDGEQNYKLTFHLDGDLEETPQYLDHAVRILRPGGTIAFVHALWRDQVADPARPPPRGAPPGPPVFPGGGGGAAGGADPLHPSHTPSPLPSLAPC